jgi:hypothetical protein
VGDLSNTEQGANHNTTEFSDITDFKSWISGWCLSVFHYIYMLPLNKNVNNL